ncbi:unnamed protein product [Pedinophyceae sp. YPF-701]|nr:unnamed protein product [Pedinophyceae sp. YPF-701]
MELPSIVDFAEEVADAPVQPDYTREGPLEAIRLPRLEHTASSCFPDCIGAQCILRADVTYPKGGVVYGVGPPYPLAIITGGFLVGAEAYQSYAERLATWGYTAITYDKVETVNDPLNDEVSARFISEIIDWAATDRSLSKICDASRVYLVGHSRGGKLSALAALTDDRVRAMCAIDPVDSTVYAPVGPGYPSATQAMSDWARQLQRAAPGQTPPKPSAAAGTSFVRAGGGAIYEELKDVDAAASRAASRAAEPARKDLPTNAECRIPGLCLGARAMARTQPLPMVVVGAGRGGDCAPRDANYTRFYDACTGPAWQLLVRDAGHFQFLDRKSALQSAVCAEGRTPDGVVRAVAQAAMVAWGEAHVRSAPGPAPDPAPAGTDAPHAGAAGQALRWPGLADRSPEEMARAASRGCAELVGRGLAERDAAQRARGKVGVGRGEQVLEVSYKAL